MMEQSILCIKLARLATLFCPISPGLSLFQDVILYTAIANWDNLFRSKRNINERVDRKAGDLH